MKNLILSRLFLTVLCSLGFLSLACAEEFFPPLSSLEPSENHTKNWEISQSFRYSSGKYGTDQLSHTYEEDTSLTRYFSRGDIRMNIPVLWQKGSILGTTVRRGIVRRTLVRSFAPNDVKATTTGLGDISFDGDYDLFTEGQDIPLNVTLTGYIKTPTASAKRGLGTGEWDGGPGIGLSKSLMEHVRAFTDTSYYFIGNVEGQKTKDQINFDIGLQYEVDPKTMISLAYEYGSAIFKGDSAAQDVALGFNYRLNDDWKLNAKGTLGLSNGSPDESIQVGISTYFDHDRHERSSSLDKTSASEEENEVTYESASGAFDPITSRILSDPLFMPYKGQVYGSSAYSYSTSSFHTYNAAGAKAATSKAYGHEFNQTLAYGFTDRFTFRITDSYDAIKTKSTNTTTNVVTSGRSNGLENPILSATYRFIDQHTHPMAVDFSASLSPNAFSAKTAGGGRDGTVASGRQPFAFTTSIGREMKMFTVQGSASAIYQGDRRYQWLANDHNYLEKGRWNYLLALNTQTRLTDRWALNLGTAFLIEDTVRASDVDTGDKWTKTPSDVLEFNTALNYQIIPQRLVGGLTYAYDTYSDFKNKFDLAALNNETKHAHSHVFGMKFQYLFN